MYRCHASLQLLSGYPVTALRWSSSNRRRGAVHLVGVVGCLLVIDGGHLLGNGLICGFDILSLDCMGLRATRSYPCTV